MTRFSRIRRRPDHWASPHERARARAAERLDGPLGLSEATWLDEHLAGCAACAAIAASYDADRDALRALRQDQPKPPRDLWARTAAAIEQESRAAGRGRPAAADGGRRRLSVGMMSGVAVVAVVVAVSAVSGGLFNGNGPTTALTDLGTPSPETTADAPASGSTLIAGAAPTPFDVGAGNVEWFGTDPDGKVAYNAAPIRKVCPVDSATSCATIDDSAGERLALTSAPKSIIGSPTQQQAVVVTDDGSGGQQITVLSLPAVQATPAPTATPSDSPSPTTVASPTPTASASVATDEPSAEPTASDPNATEPPPTEPPTESPTATDEPSAEPTATPDPTTEPTATPEPTETPVLSPEPTIATSLAIANDITVVGESAAFSADGRWFAFTARPTDGSAGPDIYVWHVGDETARRLTEGGHTYFASWDGGTVVASEEAPDAASPGDVVSTFIDPETGADQAAGDLWRPVVDPTAKRAVAWVGDVAPTANGMSILPTDGRLELRGWTSDDGSSSGDGSAQVVADGPIADFDVRWDESGTWFAVWIADATGTDVGRLSLYRVDPATGLLERPEGAPADVAALPGFSIGQGRLAWATPPGQGGEGSRVQIVAWANDGVGTVETAPGEDLIVVR